MAGNADLTKIYVTDSGYKTLAIYDSNNLSNTTTPTIKQRDNWQLYYVSDTGAIQSSEPTNKGLINHIACSEDGEIVLFGLENGKLHISTNGGTSFSEITDSIFTNNYYWTSVAVSSDGTTMAASTTSSTSPLFIYDNNTWSEYNNDIVGTPTNYTYQTQYEFIINSEDDITKYSTTTEDGSTYSTVSTSPDIIEVHEWNTFTIVDIDPNDIHFFEKEYVIDWEDDPISLQHGGYFLDYNNISHRSGDFLRYGGPIWWWYGDLTATSQSWSTIQNGTVINVDLAFRKSHRMTFKFVNDNTYSVTYTYDGISYTHNIQTRGGWTFSDKSSIQFCYKMHRTWPLGGSGSIFTTPHKFNLKIVNGLVSSINKLAVNNDLILFNNVLDSYYIKKDSNGFSSIPQLINVVTEPLPNPIYAWDFRNKSGSSVIIDSIGNQNAYFYQYSNNTNNAKTISSNVGAILNGSTDFIVTDLINYGSSFSIEVYFKPGNESEFNTYERILSAGPNGEKWSNSSKNTFTFARDDVRENDNTASFYTYLNNNPPRGIISNFFGYNTDIHFVVTFNHNTNIVNIQHNSVRNTFTLPNNYLNDVNKKIILGQEEGFNSSYYMKGTYYLLRVWDRELAKDHIEHLFNVKDIVDHF